MAAAENRVVGRSREISRIQQCLNADVSHVVYLHGIGGIGKTAVLREVLRQYDGPVAEFAASGLPTEIEQLIATAGSGLLVVDELEQVPGSADMIRERVVPRLPDGISLLLASRQGPGLRWGTDLGERFVGMELGELDEISARNLLERSGVQKESTARLLDLCHGHPLMLLLAGRLAAADGVFEDGLEAAPELVSALVETFGLLPHRQRLTDALTVSAIARRVTEPLLETVLGLKGDECRLVFETLREQDWMSVDKDGMFPHELVRDALRGDAKWRNRPRYDQLFRAVTRYGVERVRQLGTEALRDAVYLLADNPVYRGVTAHRQGVAPGPIVATEEFNLVDEILRPHHGDAFMEELTECNAQGAIRSSLLYGADGRASEAFCLLDGKYLRHAQTVNPAVLAAREMLCEFNVREDAPVIFCHGFGHRQHGQCSPLSNSRLMTAALGLGVSVPGLAALGSVLHPPEMWKTLITHSASLGIHRHVMIGDREFIVHFQDMRTQDPAGWLEAQLYPPEVSISTEVEMLDHDEFKRAVREALKAMAGKGQSSLAECRLVSAPLVFRAASTPDPAARALALERLIAQAVHGVDDARAEAALRLTYLEPAPKQYAAAVELGVSFSTFRRALTRGVDSVTETLWEEELVAAM